MKALSLITTPLFLTLALMGMAQDAHAEAGDIALGARISTLGVGPEITIGASDSLNIRAAGHWGTYDTEGKSEDVDYDCDLNLLSGLVTAEWFPFSGRTFHFVAGALLNGNNIDASGEITPGLSYEIGGTLYTSSEIGSLKGDIDYNTFAPYLGIGWGNPVHQDSNWTFFIDLGVAYQGAADVSLKATGDLANDATFQSRLQQEEKDLEDDLDSYKYYPVVALGLTYKF